MFGISRSTVFRTLKVLSKGHAGIGVTLRLSHLDGLVLPSGRPGCRRGSSGRGAVEADV